LEGVLRRKEFLLNIKIDRSQYKNQKNKNNEDNLMVVEIEDKEKKIKKKKKKIKNNLRMIVKEKKNIMIIIKR